MTTYNLSVSIWYCPPIDHVIVDDGTDNCVYNVARAIVVEYGHKHIQHCELTIDGDEWLTKLELCDAVDFGESYEEEYGEPIHPHEYA